MALPRVAGVEDSKDDPNESDEPSDDHLKEV
jgi:hypothetical protein